MTELIANPLIESVDSSLHGSLSKFLIALGDDGLILGHRLAEWCGHAPQLEEDIALANIALDEIGRANVFLKMAGELEADGRDQDRLAYFRNTVEFRNLLLVEQPNRDFGHTIARQFLYDSYVVPLCSVISASENPILAGLAKKASKEVTYHLRHSSRWVVRLGDGTPESHRRIQEAIDELWTYTDELFDLPEGAENLIESGILPASFRTIRETWMVTVQDTLDEATLNVPSDQFMRRGGRNGQHSEHLGSILDEMQVLARSHPGVEW